MKTLFFSTILLISISIKAQISPILDHTWTIDQIDTGSQIIPADLNPSGEYDTFLPIFVGIFDSTSFYFLSFGHCEGDLTFDDSNSQFFYHFSGCFLSDDNSSDIAIYFNEIFIQQNTNQTTIDNDISPFAFGPLTYSFTTVGNIIYMDITNSIGEVATFYAVNLSQDEFLKESISIYPNPVSEVLNIKSSGISIEDLKVYDMNGRLVLESHSKDGQVNMSTLQKGVYVLTVETSVGVLREKMVKK